MDTTTGEADSSLKKEKKKKKKKKHDDEEQPQTSETMDVETTEVRSKIKKQLKI